MIGICNDHFKTLPDGKVFKFTPGDEKGRAEASQKAEAHVAARRKAIETNVGRPISNDEFLDNRVSHHDDRNLMQRQRDKEFTPVKKAPGRYDAMKADLQKRIQERDVAKMDKLERQLWEIGQMEAQEADQAALAKASEDHRKNPRAEKALEELNGLFDSMKWDESRTVSEVIKVEQAIAQWSEPEGDSATATAMLKSILDYEDERDALADAEKVARIKAIEATLAPPRTGAPQKVEIDRSKPLDQQGHDLLMAMKDVEFAVFDKVYEANQALEAGDGEPIRQLIDTYAVGVNQTLAE